VFREKNGLLVSMNAARGQAVPLRMAALCAAWRRGGDIIDAVWEVGSLYALDGDGLQVLLDDVDVARAASRLPPADLALVRSLALSWSEAALGRYTKLTCTDPLTGLATAQHLQTQVVSLARKRRFGAWSLVIVETGPRRSSIDTASVPGGLFELVSLSEVATVVAREVTVDAIVARLTSRRCAALVPQDEASRLVERINAQVRGHFGSTRVWIERLPDGPDQAASLIDEICR
jgi:GGDEF domain-containing protein